MPRLSPFLQEVLKCISRADHSSREKFPCSTAEKRDLEKDGEREYRGRNSNLSDQGSRHTPDQGAMCMGKRFLLGGRFR
jgi:hypothetical protein